ncbi:hypothetical protein CDL15_Pgr010733 [Punica granatum]|uniref:Uncharacterized protein n=1 Tax=Punica granatum TaxID=22663 RepID=A0A218W4U8_PUNGR|nr:hypothetical protein CDL15_Pgr010733 [Punica granatum]
MTRNHRGRGGSKEQRGRGEDERRLSITHHQQRRAPPRVALMPFFLTFSTKSRNHPELLLTVSSSFSLYCLPWSEVRRRGEGGRYDDDWWN